MAVLAGALLSALLLNTSMAATAYAKYDLSNELGRLNQDEQDLTAQLDAKASPTQPRGCRGRARHGPHQRHGLAAAVRRQRAGHAGAGGSGRMTTPVARPRARSEQTGTRRPAPSNRAPGATLPRQRTVVVPPGTRGGPPAGPVQPGSRRRMAFLTALVVLALAVFGGRLVYVQGLKGSSIAEQARNARLTSITLIGGRGEITDADGDPLATSVERYDISVNQKLIAEFKGTGTPDVPDGAAGRRPRRWHRCSA